MKQIDENKFYQTNFNEEVNSVKNTLSFILFDDSVTAQKLFRTACKLKDLCTHMYPNTENSNYTYKNLLVQTSIFKDFITYLIDITKHFYTVSSESIENDDFINIIKVINENLPFFNKMCIDINNVLMTRINEDLKNTDIYEYTDGEIDTYAYIYKRDLFRLCEMFDLIKNNLN